MKSVLGLLTLALILAGCAATATTPAAGPATSEFTGEVCTWDQPAGVITLRQGGQYVRVKAAPDQFRGLDLHTIRTVRGTLAGPAEVQNTLTPPVPLMVSGEVDEMAVTGHATSIDPLIALRPGIKYTVTNSSWGRGAAGRLRVTSCLKHKLPRGSLMGRWLGLRR